MMVDQSLHIKALPALSVRVVVVPLRRRRNWEVGTVQGCPDAGEACAPQGYLGCFCGFVVRWQADLLLQTGRDQGAETENSRASFNTQ